MPLRIRGWMNPTPGDDLPTPIISDDSYQFKDADVKNVRAWLESTLPEQQKRFDEEGPTPILVRLGRDGNFATEYCIGAGTVERAVRFRHATAEMLLPLPGDKKVVATFHYITARDQFGRVIVGPRLKKSKLAQIHLGTICSVVQ